MTGSKMLVLLGSSPAAGFHVPTCLPQPDTTQPWHRIETLPQSQPAQTGEATGERGRRVS